MTCSNAPICDKCADTFYWSDCEVACVYIEKAAECTTSDSPLIAEFPNGDYIAMWNE